MRELYQPPGFVAEPESEHLEDESMSESQVQNLIQSSAQNSIPPQHRYHWTSGICACFDDMPICCLGTWCPCVLFGQNVEILTGRPWPGPCFMHCVLWGAVTATCCIFTQSPFGVLLSCVPGYAGGYRQAIRQKYNLEDAPCGDFITHFCCHPCANCQEHREIRERSVVIGSSVIDPPPFQTMGVPSSPTSR